MKSCSRWLVTVLLVLAEAGLLYASPVRDGLQLHLQADRIVALRDGDPVEIWPDQSGRHRDAVQDTSSQRPTYKAAALNGSAAVRFDGVDDWLSFPEIAGMRTVFWVLKEDANATANWRCLLGHSGSYGFHRGPGRTFWSTMWTDAGVLAGETAINGAVVDGTAVSVPTTYAIVSLRTTHTVAANQLTRDRDWNDRSWDGDIAELLVYDRVLSDEEMNMVGWSLQARYGLPGTYQPVTRPYNPDPYDGQTNVDPGVVLQWNAPGSEANPAYRLYLGGSADLAGVTGVLIEAATSHRPRLEHDREYYWRVDVVDGEQGDVWHFTTATAPVTCPQADLNGDCRVDFQDMGLLADQWLDRGSDLPLADRGGADRVGLDDFAVLAGQWYQRTGPLVIGEFVASNGDTLLDEDGASSDWIEIYNPTSAAVGLGGWSLTDTPDDLAKWRFPYGPTVEARGYLVVFASNKDRRYPGGVLHTNFRLDSDGEYLALVGPAGEIVSEYSEHDGTFPPQARNTSYGLIRNEKRYFAVATPGRANSGAFLGFVTEVGLSHERGFHSASFDVTCTCETEGATIYYTTDGSAPIHADGTPAAGAQTYEETSGRPHIGTTTVLRMAASKPGWKPVPVDTHTYIFLEDVIHQPALPSGFPSSWITAPGRVSPVPAESDYEMDPYVVDHQASPRDASYYDRHGEPFNVKDALLSIPTLSLVTDVQDMFGLERGIYANATGKGFDWERPASVEYIDPAGGIGFQANCGIRTHGGWNRYPEMLKKAFRLYFRERYGAARLEFPFFGDSDLSSYDQIVLRSGNGQAWPSPWRSDARLRATQYLRDQFARDCLRDMGQPTVHGNFVHLYINGLYWGLYNAVERPTADFLASYQNGNETDYDAVKWNRGESPNPSVTDGNLEAWNAMLRIADRTLDDGVTPYVSTAQGYADIDRYLNVESLIDYMIMNIFINNVDWPDNNAYAIGNRQSGDGFRFFSWDAEESLNSLSGNRVDVSNYNTSAWLYARLRSNAEFRVLFADRVHRHFFHGGALTSEAADARWMVWAEQLDRAVVAESARWGDLFRTPPYGRDDWLTEQNRLRFSFFTVSAGQNRSEVVLGQFQAAGLYPGVASPEFRIDGSPRHGGLVSRGASLSVTVSDGPHAPRVSAAIWYTTDGSDPRLPGGAVGPTAVPYDGPVVLMASTRVKARALSNGQWSALNDAVFPVMGTQHLKGRPDRQ